MTNDFPSDKSQRERLDKLCDRFEAAWNGLSRLTIEEVLRDAVETDRSQALWMLVELEVDYRRRDRETPTLDEYTARFPELNDRLPDLFLAPKMIASQSPTKFLPKSGERLGNYELLEELGKGGMGIVFKARQLKPNRLVALKMILAGSLATKEMLDRFRNEADAAAKLDHSGIVPVYEVDEVDGIHFYSMGLVEGESLAKLVQSGPLPPREAAEMVRQIANAVHYAHERGVIHRDLKPANILLARGAGFQTAEATPTRLANDSPQPTPSSTPQVGQRPRSSGSGTERESDPRSATVWEAKVTDFGLAKLTEIDSGLTATGHVIGTPSYMPPEQARGDHDCVGRHSDVYSLGAILYCLLLGHPPFRAASAAETLRQVIDQEPVPPRRQNPALPRDLETICLKCLQKEPSRRYATALELAEELGRYLRREPILARPVSSIERLWLLAVRNPIVASLTAATVILLAAIAAISTNAYLATRRTLAESYLDRALSDAEQGEIADSLLRFTKALETVPATDSDFDWVARSNVASWSPVYEAPSHVLHHDSEVRSVQFSPDGKTLLTGSAGKATFWDAESGEPTGEVILPEKTVPLVAYVPKRDQIATLSQNGILQVWNTTSREADGPPLMPPADCEGHALAISPNGTFILAGYHHWKLRLWRTATGECVAEWSHSEIRHDKGWVYSAGFNGDGTWVITSGMDGTAKVWDIVNLTETRQPTLLQTLKHLGYVFGAVIAGADRAFTTSVTSAQLWDLKSTPTVNLTFSHRGVTCLRGLAFEPTTRRFATAGEDRNVHVWDIDTGERIRSFRHDDRVFTVAFSPDGSLVASGSDDKTVRIWKLSQKTSNELRVFAHGGDVGTVRFSHDGKQVVTASNDKTAVIWNLDESQPKQQFLHPGPLRSAELSADGTRLLTAGDGRVFVYDVKKPAEPTSSFVRENDFLATTAFARDGASIVTGSEKGLVERWNLTSGMADLIGRHEDAVVHVAVAPKTSHLLSCSRDRTARIWLSDGGQPIVLPHETSVESAIYSPDGTLVATVAGNTAQVWDAQTGHKLSRPMRHNDGIWSLAFSPDSRSLLTGARDKTARLWDARSGTPIRSLQHRNGVIVVGFHPQGHLLATGDTSGRFQFWHVATGRAIGPSLMHDYPATSLDFSPDGRTLATSAHDVRARLWQVPEPMTGTPQKITRAIQILTRSELDADGVIRPLTKEEVDQRLRPSAEARQK